MAPPLRAEYLNFWNEEGLRLFKAGHKKPTMEALVKRNWNMKGRFDAYIRVGKTVAHMHKLDVNWDDRYRRLYEEQLSKIADIEKSRTLESDTLIDRIRKGIISPTDKKSKRELLKKLENDLEIERMKLDKIAKNWGVKINTTKRDGGQAPKKRGRPAKTVSGVTFKTAKELKSMPKRKINDEEPQEMDIENELQTTETEICHVVPQTEVDINGNIVHKEIETDVIEIEMETKTLINNNKSTSSSSSKIRKFRTESSLTVVIPEICQNTVDDQNSGSSACMGICLLIFKDFVQNPISLSKKNIPQIMNVYKENVEMGYNYWKINELPPMDTKTALKLPILQVLSEKTEMKSDTMWHEKLLVNGFKDGFEALKHEMESVKDSSRSGIFLVTVNPDKSFAILYDEDFNLILFDSHLHYTAPLEQMSFEEAKKRVDCRGMIIIATKSQYLDLITCIITVVIRELRASAVHGNIVRLEKKN